MESVNITFNVSTTGPDLCLRVSLGDTVIYEGSPGYATESVCYALDDSQDLDRCLCFEMSGKLPEHTKLSASGDIAEDRYITITDVTFDGLALGHRFHELATYHHDHNGSTDPVTEPFYGTMGCNGRVEFRFSTPIYLWLLENM